MLLSLYSIGFLLCILTLGGWFFLQKKDHPWAELFRWALFGSLGIYLIGVGTAESAFSVKMGAMFRDFMIVGVSGLAFLFFGGLKKSFWAGLTVMAIAVFIFFKFQLGTNAQNEAIKLNAQGELLVELKEGFNVSVLNQINSKYGLVAKRAFTLNFPEDSELDDYFVVNIPDRHIKNLEDIKTELIHSGLIDWVEGNEEITVAPIKKKKIPSINKKYGVNDPDLNKQWGFEPMGVDKLYDYLKTNNVKPVRKARVFILDTGVDAAHEDLKAHYKSVNSKYDNDPRGHGTHCAGIAAAVSNNGVGVASFYPNGSFVELTSIKVLSSSGMGTQRQIIQGIIDAADNGADVISLSLGGRSNQSRQTAYNKAMKYATDKGAIVVVAAGNSNRNAKDYAPVNAKGVIGVSAIDQKLDRAVFSNYVSDIPMGVAAPGVDVYSTLPGSKYGALNGTSMATPYVAGLAGLLKSIQPNLTTKEVYQILTQTGRSTSNNKETGKLIQPFEAVKRVVEGPTGR